MSGRRKATPGKTNGIESPSFDLLAGTDSKTHFFSHSIIAFSARSFKEFTRSFDACCCRFLQIDYAAFAAQAIQGGADEALFRWACTHGRQPSNKDVEIWNAFKRCWRDQYTSRLHVRLQEAGLPIGSVLTMFDFIDLDEGRPLPFRELELT